ncbi:MAG: hypothetical protein QXY05_02005 [Candidatus Anstonellales archaeon]
MNYVKNNINSAIAETGLGKEVRFYLTDEILKSNDLDVIIAALKNAIRYLEMSGYSEEDLKPFREVVRDFNKSTEIIMVLCAELNRMTDGKIPTAYLPGLEGIDDVAVPPELKSLGVRSVDVVYRLYQISYIIRRYDVKLPEEDAKQLKQLIDALATICYAASIKNSNLFFL